MERLLVQHLSHWLGGRPATTSWWPRTPRPANLASAAVAEAAGFRDLGWRACGAG
jgi:hypothetical protein